MEAMEEFVLIMITLMEQQPLHLGTLAPFHRPMGEL
jgi:hypothetical protein